MSDTNPISYVRETMLDQQEPPVTERGAIKWLRENLFFGLVEFAADGCIPWGDLVPNHRNRSMADEHGLERGIVAPMSGSA